MGRGGGAVINEGVQMVGMPVRGDREARYLSLIGDEPRLLDEMVSRMTGGVATRNEGGEWDHRYEGLPEICRDWDVSYGKVLGWLMADESRYAVYQRALEIQAKGLVSEVVGLADGAEDVAKAKLMVDTRFRLAKYHDSRVYGDKVDVNHNVTPVFMVTINNGGVAGGDMERVVSDDVTDEDVL